MIQMRPAPRHAAKGVFLMISRDRAGDVGIWPSSRGTPARPKVAPASAVRRPMQRTPITVWFPKSPLKGIRLPDCPARSRLMGRGLVLVARLTNQRPAVAGSRPGPRSSASFLHVAGQVEAPRCCRLSAMSGWCNALCEDQPQP